MFRGLIIRITRLLNTLQPLSLLMIRLLLGVVFLRSGWGKLQHLDKVIEFFTQLGIPAAKLQAPMVAMFEVLGGAALILGAGVRVFSLVLSGVMAVAIMTSVYPGLEDKSDLLSSPELIYFFCLIYLLTRGAEKLSLDHLIGVYKE